MSSEELLVAYSEGRISRRALMRRLAAAGVSVGAAVTYAHVLAPEAKARSAQLIANEYPEGTIKILSSKLNAVVKKEKVKVRARTERGGRYRIQIYLLGKRRSKLLGSEKLRMQKNKAEEVKVKVDTKRLKGKRKAEIVAVLQFKQDRGYAGFPFDQRELD